MAKNETALGHTKKVIGYSVGPDSGKLIIDNGWPGVVVKDIIGTTEPLETLGGVPVTDDLGDGKGDIAVEGVYSFLDESYPGSPLADGDEVYQGATDAAGGASGVVGTGASGIFVGHVWEEPFDEADETVAGGTVRKVHVKLLGRPNTL